MLDTKALKASSYKFRRKNWSDPAVIETFDGFKRRGEQSSLALVEARENAREREREGEARRDVELDWFFTN